MDKFHQFSEIFLGYFDQLNFGHFEMDFQINFHPFIEYFSPFYQIPGIGLSNH